MRALRGVVLAAGEGRRLRPLTDTCPKPLLPVLNVPLLRWSVRSLEDAGALGITANIRYLADQFVETDQTGWSDHALMHFVREDHLSGPAGGLQTCLRDAMGHGEAYLVMHGDVHVDGGLSDLVAAGDSHGEGLTVLATQVPDPWRYGALEVEFDRLVGWSEKSEDASPTALINCGVYYVGALAADLIREADLPYPSDFVDLVPALIAQGMPAHVHSTTAKWTDVGDIDRYLELNLRLLFDDQNLSTVARKANGPGVFVQGTDVTQPAETRGRVLLGHACDVSAAYIEDSVIGAGATLGDGCSVTRSVVQPGSVVPAGARLTDTVYV